MTKIEQEKKTVGQMIKIYCNGNHHKEELCDECAALLEYAHERLDHCRFGENKKKCKVCPIHCYRPDMREAIRRVMRYSGPRMMIYHPIVAIKQIFS